MTRPKVSVKVWEDERAKESERWAVTVRKGSFVRVLRFPTKRRADAAARDARKYM